MDEIKIRDDFLPLWIDEEDIKNGVKLAKAQAEITWDKAIREVVEQIVPIASRLSVSLDTDQDVGDMFKEISGLVFRLHKKLEEWGIK